MNETTGHIDDSSRAYGISAVITIIFNTLLAILKDIYPALQKTMAFLSGHHWITHAAVDIMLFFTLGFILQKMNRIKKFDATKLVSLFYIASILSVFGLVGWFFFV